MSQLEWADMLSSNLPVLYSFRRCPYAMRARLAIYSAHINYEHREIDLKYKPAEMLRQSPKGTVPVLILSSGQGLEESLDIMKWALNLSELKVEESHLIHENDTTFKYALDRYKYPGRYCEDANIDYRHQCEKFLKKLEDRLQPFLNSQEFCFLDMAIFPFVRQFSMVDPEWFELLPFTNLKAWLNRISSSALFDQVMQKYNVWDAANAPIEIIFEKESTL